MILYLLSEGTRGPCKIGVAANDFPRFPALQEGNSRELVPECAWECCRARDIKRRVHARLSPFRVRGEWFYITPKQAEIEISLVLAEWYGPDATWQREHVLLNKPRKKAEKAK